MNLTDVEYWSARKAVTLQDLDAVEKHEEWVGIVRSLLAGQKGRYYLELGCAPGLYTAAICRGTAWDVSGIDYSDAAGHFEQAMAMVGISGKAHLMDVFEESLGRKFDVVCSFGLVEHFRGEKFDQLLRIHDEYVAEGGCVVISMPNLSGFHYVWRYIFARDDLDMHNVDATHPSALSFFDSGYDILFKGYAGTLRVWVRAGAGWPVVVRKVFYATMRGISISALLLKRLGFDLTGRSWSPTVLLVARKRFR